MTDHHGLSPGVPSTMSMKAAEHNMMRCDVPVVQAHTVFKTTVLELLRQQYRSRYPYTRMHAMSGTGHDVNCKKVLFTVSLYSSLVSLAKSTRCYVTLEDMPYSLIRS